MGLYFTDREPVWGTTAHPIGSNNRLRRAGTI